MTNDNEVRSKLSAQISALLMGPLEPREIIDSAPADTYLTGILWPQGDVQDPADDDMGAGAGGENDPEVELSIPGYRAVRPCSIGITFAVDAGSTVVVNLADTARYVPEAVDSDENSAGGVDVSSTSSNTRWTRTAIDYTVQIAADMTSATWKTNTFIRADGSTVEDPRIVLHIRRRAGALQQVFTVTVINADTEGGEGERRDVHCLFQAGISVAAKGPAGGAAIRPRPAPSSYDGDEDAQTSALLYRDVGEYAVGHGVAAVWGDPIGLAVGEVRTSWLPQAVVKGTSATGHPLMQGFSEAHPDALSAKFLSNEGERVQVVAAMRAFADSYAGWIHETLRPRLSSFHGTLLKAASRNLTRCEETVGRMRAGIDALEQHDQAWAAFALANLSMDRQSHFASKGSRRKALVWRPFQLAFMLLVIPGLIDPRAPDRECMDLLWFPTGGGKTEAYLALTAFQIFLRRLTEDQRREQGGVDVLMRYTLRLLTVQQFQRAAALISACDAIRSGDSRLGPARITLGLYVGADATPNSMEQARTALQEERDGQGPKSTPRQLLRCPVCGSDLPSGAYRASPDHPNIDIVCAAAECETRGTPLPVITVDEAIYAAPPSLLIGTIDKFAQLPRRTDIRQLFGLGTGSGPGLIIQDELHLISGPLGSMAGLYETVVDLLCTRDGIRPKIIGSTATIGQAARQVKALFDRSVLQFPPPGFDAADSFFAVRDEQGPDRIYMGASSAGRSPKFALMAVMAALLQTSGAILSSGKTNRESIDPFWTCVAYFNSLRELGGAYVLMQDDVPRQMTFLAGRLKSVQRVLEMPPVELSSRVPSRDLPAVLQSLEAPLNEDAYAECPKDTVLASNMISVGVDVPRLGLMVVNGQPKTTAEYIQASSRVGRNTAGLVVTLFNFGRPRDLSHFEHFRGYHSALYRSVEATSVTPWSPRARDKALHAVVIAAIRHLVPGLAGDDDAVRFDPGDPEVIRLKEQIAARIDSSSQGVETDDAREDIAAIVAQWARLSQDGRTSGTTLRYWERKAPFGKTAPHLMRAAEESGPSTKLAWTTPNSMREVEPSTAFVLKRNTATPGKSNGDDR